MVFAVSDAVRAKCLEYDVRIRPGAQFGYLGQTSFAVEAPVDIRPGLFDIDLIAAFTYLGDHQTFQGSFYRHVNLIGRFCAIAGRVAIGPAEHPTSWLSSHMMFHGGCDWREAEDFRARNREIVERAILRFSGELVDAHGPVQIGNDVWIGEGAFIRSGVSIGDGAIIGAHAVVTKDVPPYAIVGGVPARVIRYRFEPEVIQELLGLQWWQYGLSALEGADFTNVDVAIQRICENIGSGRAQPYSAPILQISENEVDVINIDAA